MPERARGKGYDSSRRFGWLGQQRGHARAGCRVRWHQSMVAAAGNKKPRLSCWWIPGDDRMRANDETSGRGTLRARLNEGWKGWTAIRRIWLSLAYPHRVSGPISEDGFNPTCTIPSLFPRHASPRRCSTLKTTRKTTSLASMRTKMSHGARTSPPEQADGLQLKRRPAIHP